MSHTRLIVMDVDSTFINQEVIDLLGEKAGVGDRMARITSEAMRGETDFASALAERVELLRGLSVEALAEVRDEVTYTPGALELVAEAHRRGWKVGVVSGGFREIVDDLARTAHLDYWCAGGLEVVDGKLSGKTVGPIVTRETKLLKLRAWAADCGIAMVDTVAIGDGANDIPMIQAAGVGIAFCAKPATRAAAPYAIDERNLMRAFDIIDRHDASASAQL